MRTELRNLVHGLCLVSLAGCTQQMANDAKHKPLSKSEFYDDQRSARPLVPGTVPRGYLRQDEAFYTGKIGTNLVRKAPIPITMSVLERGRERYEIFCSPCHGRLGNGDGMVVRRGFRAPPSYHLPRLRDAPDGHFFDVMSNGFGAMPEYAGQIAPEDRWAIVDYIRALQLSQNATLKDLPGEEARRLEQQK